MFIYVDFRAKREKSPVKAEKDVRIYSFWEILKILRPGRSYIHEYTNVSHCSDSSPPCAVSDQWNKKDRFCHYHLKPQKDQLFTASGG